MIVNEKSCNKKIFSLEGSGIEAEMINDFRSFKKINEISRQYLMLMMKMQESPLLFNLFSEPDFSESNRKVYTTALTASFLTQGLVIYNVVSLDGKYQFKNDKAFIESTDPDKVLEYPLRERGIFGVPVDENSNYRTNVLEYMHEEFGTPLEEEEIKVNQRYQSKKNPQNGGFKVYVMERESGCGFHIPEDSIIRLDPRLVWTQTKLKLKHNVDANESNSIGETNDGIYIINTAGGVEWFQSDWKSIDELDNTSFMQKEGKALNLQNFQSCTFQELSNSKTKMKVLGNNEGRVEKAIIIMPFICCAFDMLTEVYYNGKTEPVILFTT